MATVQAAEAKGALEEPYNYYQDEAYLQTVALLAATRKVPPRTLELILAAEERALEAQSVSYRDFTTRAVAARTAGHVAALRDFGLLGEVEAA